MYTAVLMLAMTSAPETIDWGRRGGCSGSYNSCYGGYCYGGCFGGGYAGGCSGGYGGYAGGCSGGYGGYAGGCCGGGYGGGYYRSSYYGGMGGYYVGPVNYYGNNVMVSNMPTNPNTNTNTNGRAPATMVVNVPANAKVTIDGSPTKSTGEVRTYVTPQLDPGATFVYNVRASLGDEKAASETKEVIVRAGQTSVVRFTLTPQGSASR